MLMCADRIKESHYVDDIDMEITHVVRGDDHISNTPKQVLLYQAFGTAGAVVRARPADPRARTRSASASVTARRRSWSTTRLGYLPEAMVNFLSLLGWSPGSDEELFTRDELIARFTLEGISGGNAVFNPEKLDWFNQQHILRLPTTGAGDNGSSRCCKEQGLWSDDVRGCETRLVPRTGRLTSPG